MTTMTTDSPMTEPHLRRRGDASDRRATRRTGGSTGPIPPRLVESSAGPPHSRSIGVVDRRCSPQLWVRSTRTARCSWRVQPWRRGNPTRRPRHPHLVAQQSSAQQQRRQRGNPTPDVRGIRTRAGTTVQCSTTTTASQPDSTSAASPPGGDNALTHLARPRLVLLRPLRRPRPFVQSLETPVTGPEAVQFPASFRQLSTRGTCDGTGPGRRCGTASHSAFVRFRPASRQAASAQCSGSRSQIHESGWRVGCHLQPVAAER